MDVFLPREWNGVVDTLANNGINNHASKLYFKGIDHPFWLMKLVEEAVWIYKSVCNCVDLL